VPMLLPRRVMYPVLRGHLSERIAVSPALEADAIDDLPLVTFSTSIGSAIDDYEGMPTAWEASTVLNVFATTADEAEAICGALYDLFRSFNNPWLEPRPGLVPNYSLLVEVTDRDGFDLVGSASIPGRNVVQYAGSFGHQVHAVTD
jgi:hypothetical protein